MNLPQSFLLLALTGLVGTVSAANPPSDPAHVAFFEKKIRPVLVEHCHKCHSADAAKANQLKGGLLLDSRAALTA